MEWVNVIQTLGFPIACVVACGLFIYNIITRDKDEAKEREKALIEANTKNSDALKEVANTIHDTNSLNKELSEKNKELIGVIDNKLEVIKHNVEDIKDAVNK